MVSADIRTRRPLTKLGLSPNYDLDIQRKKPIAADARRQPVEGLPGLFVLSVQGPAPYHPGIAARTGGVVDEASTMVWPLRRNPV
jgi:hypothetical protein